MVDTKVKTKAAMLNELESIKGLLLEEDDIPILQEVIEQQIIPDVKTAIVDEFETPAVDEAETLIKTPARIIVEEQQDFFGSHMPDVAHETYLTNLDSELLDTIEELEKHTAEVTANKFAHDVHKASSSRPSLAKATGENPFLPAHIRSRLHGNNPPPLFAQETAKKIANSSVPSRLLGNTSLFTSPVKTNLNQQDIIDSIIDKLMPDIEKELRARLEVMSKNLLDELNNNKAT